MVAGMISLREGHRNTDSDMANFSIFGYLHEVLTIDHLLIFNICEIAHPDRFFGSWFPLDPLHGPSFIERCKNLLTFPYKLEFGIIWLIEWIT